MNELSQIIYLLGNFGFPVAISVYLLFRFENVLRSWNRLLMI
ncbi:MAG: YvrJ family protein [Novibacillus thermophilus]|uniref:YvrJ family protein n=1 Tax=Novibacillus thermophilus TaxID=1471761 RepID=A0A1U9K7I3_9BACL|nr:YvrJ family protein [Novibacillus thermophilus]AQS55981.1 hypothetical protein B0W44_09575 [Novibacillus thermophilus]